MLFFKQVCLKYYIYYIFDKGNILFDGPGSCATGSRPTLVTGRGPAPWTSPTPSLQRWRGTPTSILSSSVSSMKTLEKASVSWWPWPEVLCELAQDWPWQRRCFRGRGLRPRLHGRRSRPVLGCPFSRREWGLSVSWVVGGEWGLGGCMERRQYFWLCGGPRTGHWLDCSW